MTGDIESIAGGLADIGTGAAVAGAIERERSGGDGHTHEGACLNCGTELVGPHCHACGQRAHVHRTLGAFFHDLLHGVLHFEGKTWRTIPMLAWKPGQLTREYIDGKRARYVSPIALFLFVVFLSFALFSMRSTTITRLYFQVPPEEPIERWSDEAIWQEMLTRMATSDGWKPNVGRANPHDGVWAASKLRWHIVYLFGWRTAQSTSPFSDRPSSTVPSPTSASSPFWPPSNTPKRPSRTVHWPDCLPLA